MSSDKANTLLIVEDDLALQKQIKWSLDQFESVTADDRQSAMVQLRRFVPAVVTMDLGLPPDADSVSEGFKLLEQILAAEPDTKVIVLTGQNGQANALKAIAMGAYDFLAKPFEPEVLALTVERAFRLAELQAENRRLQSMQTPDALAGLITKDPGMLRVCRTIEKVASSNVTVMLLGESGTGKEVLARGLHQSSGRKANKFVAINCAAIPDNLLESELFGHEKGAFTGAVARRIGKFEEADGGTLLLDEISEMDARLQAKLLRAIQERVIDRVGGSKPVPVNIRIIATSNRDLAKAVAEGTFREDLLYRLNVVNLRLPSLRERPGDIAVLSDHFIRKYAAANGVPPRPISVDARRALVGHRWPGNVRELENAMHRAVLLATGPEIDIDAIRLPDGRPLLEGGSTAPSPTASTYDAGVAGHAAQMADAMTRSFVGQTVAEMEKTLILDTLNHCLGNRTHAATILGISIRTLRNKLNEYKRRQTTSGASPEAKFAAGARLATAP